MATHTRRDELLENLIELFLREGFVHLSIADMAAHLNCSKSTLYLIADSKEQLFAAVVRAYFKRATEAVEAGVDHNGDPASQVEAYLMGISEQLARATELFFADVEEFAPAREIYRANTNAAAHRVANWVTQATGDDQIGFLAVVAARTMEAIHRGDISATTGMTDAEAYQALSRLIVASIPR
jgi:AcrR family transcriptional regulator